MPLPSLGGGGIGGVVVSVGAGGVGYNLVTVGASVVLEAATAAESRTPTLPPAKRTSFERQVSSQTSGVVKVQPSHLPSRPQVESPLGLKVTCLAPGDAASLENTRLMNPIVRGV